MDHYPSDFIVEAFQLFRNTGTDPVSKAGASVDVVIAVNLDLHTLFLLNALGNHRSASNGLT
jgi:hypothetical protein